jgi:hypothetical protein
VATPRQCPRVPLAQVPLAAVASAEDLRASMVAVAAAVVASAVVVPMDSVVVAILDPEEETATTLVPQAEPLLALALTGETAVTVVSVADMTREEGARTTIDLPQARAAETAHATAHGMVHEMAHATVHATVHGMAHDSATAMVADELEATWSLLAAAKVGIVTETESGIETTTGPATTITESVGTTVAATKILESCVGTKPHWPSLGCVARLLTLCFSVFSFFPARVSRGIRCIHAR